MSAKLRPLFRIEPSFEQGPEDRGVEGIPRSVRRGLQAAQILVVQFGHRHRAVQAAVEVRDVIAAEITTVLHGREEIVKRCLQ